MTPSIGEEVGDAIGSVLATCHENGVNASDYLRAMQRHAKGVPQEPQRRMPWYCPKVPETGEASQLTCPVTRADGKLTVDERGRPSRF